MKKQEFTAEYFIERGKKVLGDKMTFGEAIKALKEGFLVTRTGWNGKNMFLWLKPATVIKEEWCKDPILLQICQDNGGEVEALGTICMKTADNKVLTGWLASQTDMLSDDWEIYTNYNYNGEEKEMPDFDYSSFMLDEHAPKRVDMHEVERLRKEMGMGVSEEEKAATHEKIANTTNSLQASIQQDVFKALQEKDRVHALNVLREKYIAEAKDDEEKIFVVSQFDMFLDYVKNN